MNLLPFLRSGKKRKIMSLTPKSSNKKLVVTSILILLMKKTFKNNGKLFAKSVLEVGQKVLYFIFKELLNYQKFVKLFSYEKNIMTIFVMVKELV